MQFSLSVHLQNPISGGKNHSISSNRIKIISAKINLKATIVSLNLCLNFSVPHHKSRLPCQHGLLVTQGLNGNCAQTPCIPKASTLWQNWEYGTEHFQACLSFYFRIQLSLLWACILFSSQPRMYEELSFQGSFIYKALPSKVWLDHHFSQSSLQPQASRDLIFHPCFPFNLLRLRVWFSTLQNQPR